MGIAQTAIEYLDNYQRKAKRSSKILKKAEYRRKNERRKEDKKLQSDLDLCSISTIDLEGIRLN